MQFVLGYLLAVVWEPDAASTPGELGMEKSRTITNRINEEVTCKKELQKNNNQTVTLNRSGFDRLVFVVVVSLPGRRGAGRGPAAEQGVVLRRTTRGRCEQA